MAPKERPIDRRVTKSDGAVVFNVSAVEAASDRAPSTDLAQLLAVRGVEGIEALRASHERVIAADAVNPLLQLFHLAFAEHRPLALRPDDLWLAIAKGIGMHVERHAEELRSRLVRHEGTLEIEIRRDEFSAYASQNDWPGVVTEIVDRVRTHIGGRADLFRCDFSTTGPFERVASEVVLLDAMKSYFSFSVLTLCGIPQIRLEGTVADWRNIRRRLRVIEELAVSGDDALDVVTWSRRLDQVLEKIEQSASGLVDHDFWRSGYKWGGGSGGERVTGWIHAFFPFLTEGKRNPYAARPFEGRNRFEGVPLDEFPDAISCVPFEWQVFEKCRAMEMWAGPFAVTEDPSGFLRIVHAWAIAPRGSMRRAVFPFTLTRGETNTVRGSPTVRSLKALTVFSELTHLELDLSDCEALDSLDGIEALDVRSLRLSNCVSLKDLSALASLENLESLSLVDCTNITSLRPIAGLTKLQELTLWGNTNISKDLWKFHKNRQAVAELQAQLISESAS
jgi:hypothetical protein